MMCALKISRLRASLAELIQDFKLLAIHHGDVRITVVRNVQESLLLVWRERQTNGRPSCWTCPIEKHLGEVLALRREELHAPVRSIGDIDDPIVRHFDAVHRTTTRRPISELIRSRAFRIEPGCRCAATDSATDG